MSDRVTTDDRVSLDASADIPLWQQVLTDLEARLDAGEFTTRFPTDRELVERYGTSRHTVREAVRHLKARGVIERERGRGSVVTAPSGIAQPMGALYNLFQTVEEAGYEQRSRVLALDLRADARAAERFGLEPGTPLVHLERLRLMDDDPLALDTAWITPDIGRPLLDADFEHTSLYDELAARTGVRPTGGFESLSAVMPDAATREVLCLEADEAVMRINRLTSHAGRTIEWRLTLLRTSRLALVTAWPDQTGLAGQVVTPSD
ncbi:GntR family transcriptional regulator [Euzebya tangerina]|uniref:GntR family transcriptional regulator n=1 Tax=Euzebya tangerina TaxID=591198 RepID=UPI000E3143CE|nr:GntR family transcriptional regulator [Euzebya tangerina]